MAESNFDRIGGQFIGGLAVGLYGWIYAVYFGIVLLDGTYAGQLKALLEPATAAGIFSEISDFLLVPLGLLVLVGAAAYAAAKRRSRVRIPVTISWLLLVALIALQPLAGSLLDDTGYGTVVRLLTVGSGSVFALVGSVRFQRPEFAP